MGGWGCKRCKAGPEPWRRRLRNSSLASHEQHAESISSPLDAARSTSQRHAQRSKARRSTACTAHLRVRHDHNDRRRVQGRRRGLAQARPAGASRVCRQARAGRHIGGGRCRMCCGLPCVGATQRLHRRHCGAAGSLLCAWAACTAARSLQCCVGPRGQRGVPAWLGRLLRCGSHDDQQRSTERQSAAQHSAVVPRRAPRLQSAAAATTCTHMAREMHAGHPARTHCAAAASPGRNRRPRSKV